MSDPQAYAAFLDGVDQKGITLEEYRTWLKYDDNLPWRIGPGHLENLLDEAIDKLDTLETS